MLTCAVIDAVKISIALALARVLIKVIENKGLRQEAGEERCRHRNVEVRGKGKGCRPHFKLMGPMYSAASAAAAYT